MENNGSYVVLKKDNILTTTKNKVELDVLYRDIKEREEKSLYPNLGQPVHPYFHHPPLPYPHSFDPLV